MEQIADLPLAMTWAIQSLDHRLHYVTSSQAIAMEDSGLDWQMIALRNAAALSSAGGFGEKLDASGRPFVKVMLNDDGLGPTRLFTPHLFDEELGGDYRVAVPELTCAVAFRKQLTPEQEGDIEAMIAGCFANGTTPVSDQRFAADVFWAKK